MDTNLVISSVISVLGFCVAWWVKNIWSMVTKLQDQVNDLHVELFKNYVPRAELQQTFNRLFSKLDEIQDDLRKKQ